MSIVGGVGRPRLIAQNEPCLCGSRQGFCMAVSLGVGLTLVSTLQTPYGVSTPNVDRVSTPPTLLFSISNCLNISPLRCTRQSNDRIPTDYVIRLFRRGVRW